MAEDLSESTEPFGHQLGRWLRNQNRVVRLVGLFPLFGFFLFNHTDWRQLFRSFQLVPWFFIMAFMIWMCQYLTPFAYSNVVKIDHDLAGYLKVTLFLVVIIVLSIVLAKKLISEKNNADVMLFIDALMSESRVSFKLMHRVLLTLSLYLLVVTAALAIVTYSDWLSKLREAVS